MKSFPALLLAALLPCFPAVHAEETSIRLADPMILAAQFPESGRGLTGGASHIEADGNAAVLHAQRTEADGQTVSRATIYSTPGAEYDFLAGAKTFTFSPVLQSFPQSTSTYTAELGVFCSGEGKSILSQSTRPRFGVYVQLDRYNKRLAVIQLVNGTPVPLAQWKVGDVISFESIALTLGPASWALSATSKGQIFNNENADAGSAFVGVYKTNFTVAQWPAFCLGVQADVSGKNPERFITLKVGQITVAPAN
jgi:hypothetical protein